MIELHGKYTKAKIFTDIIDSKTLSQIQYLINQPYTKGSTVRIMPDTHAGKDCIIGTTMTIEEEILPSLVGGDIGCGVTCVKLDAKTLDLAAIDQFIRAKIPSGADVRSSIHPNMRKIDLKKLHCYSTINTIVVQLSLGTLGGGNHFIEINQDKEGFHYLVVHSGCRALGRYIVKAYQRLAVSDDKQQKMEAVIKQCKLVGEDQLISQRLEPLKQLNFDKTQIPLRGQLLQHYLKDMDLAQQYASLNRQTIIEEIVKAFDFKILEKLDTIHNYIDLEDGLLRKGAVSAKAGERLIIPINMRDGSILAVGKGNPDWNYSAPHGAGRLLSRGAAKEQLSLEDFKVEMAHIFTTSVCQSTLDESPMAYKSMEQILDYTTDTFEVLEVIEPVYNFKATALEKDDSAEKLETLSV